MNKSEWRVLEDQSGAEMVDDPTGASYTFVKVYDGKIIEREEGRTGFTCHNDFIKQTRVKLEAQLKALDYPFIREVKQTKLEGLKMCTE